MVIKKRFTTYEEANNFVKEHEISEGLSFVTWKVNAGFSDSKLTCLKQRKIRFPNEEIPHLYIANGKNCRSCSMGGRSMKNKLYRRKVRAGREPCDALKEYKEKEIDDMPICTAEAIIKSFFVFPQYEFNIKWDKRRKSAVTNSIRESFTPSMYYEVLFIVDIDEKHANHRKNFPFKTDDSVIEFIYTIVDLGYFAPGDVNERVKQFLAKKEGLDTVDVTKSRLYPGQDRLRKLCFPRAVKMRNMQREKGFSHDFTEGLEKMKELESETETQYLCCGDPTPFGQLDVYEVAKTKEILTSPECTLRCKLDSCCVPYIILQARNYECSYGVDYKNKFLNPFTPQQRKHMSKEGMVMCTAMCQFKEVALFPGYRIDDAFSTKHVRDKIYHRLRHDLTNRTAVYERGVAYAFPVVEEHNGHPVREANGHVFLDETIKSQINELVEEGVKSVSEMRRHLKMYLKHTFDAESIPGPFNKKYRPSNQTLMNLMYDAGLAPEEIIQDVHDPVPYISKPSLYRDISTRLEEKRRKNDASASMSIIPEGETLVESSYDAIIDNLDVFQTMDMSPSKTSQRDISPSKLASNTTDTTSEEKNDDQFSDTLFKKQSACQAILEELLQDIYQLNDLFRLRDIHVHLQKLIDCVKHGRLLCDIIPLKRKKPAKAAPSATWNSGNDNMFTATPVSLESGLPSTSNADPAEEESLTKLEIKDQNDEVTEVEIPKAYDSSEIVIYQEPDGEDGDQIYLVDQKSLVYDPNAIQNEPAPDTAATSKWARMCFRDASAIKRIQELREEARKDHIKMRCKQYFTKEEIINSLEINIIKPKKSSHNPVANIGTGFDRKRDLREQVAEILEFEKQKRELNLFNLKLIKEEKMIQDDLKKANKHHDEVKIKQEPIEDLEDHHNTEMESNAVEAKMNKSRNIQMDHLYSETTSINEASLEGNKVTDNQHGKATSLLGTSDISKMLDKSRINNECEKGDSSKIENDNLRDDDDHHDASVDMRDEEEDSNTGNECERTEVVKEKSMFKKKSDKKDKITVVSLDSEKERKETNKSDIERIKKFLACHPSIPRKSLITNKVKIATGLPKATVNTAKTRDTAHIKMVPKDEKQGGFPLNLKAGDTITIPQGAFNPLNQCLSGGLVSINNILYTNTPFGLVQAVGMPVIMGANNQPLVIGSPTLPVPSSQAVNFNSGIQQLPNILSLTNNQNKVENVNAIGLLANMQQQTNNLIATQTTNIVQPNSDVEPSTNNENEAGSTNVVQPKATVEPTPSNENKVQSTNVQPKPNIEPSPTNENEAESTNTVETAPPLAVIPQCIARPVTVVTLAEDNETTICEKKMEITSVKQRVTTMPVFNSLTNQFVTAKLDQTSVTNQNVPKNANVTQPISNILAPYIKSSSASPASKSKVQQETVSKISPTDRSANSSAVIPLVMRDALEDEEDGSHIGKESVQTQVVKEKMVAGNKSLDNDKITVVTLNSEKERKADIERRKKSLACLPSFSNKQDTAEGLVPDCVEIIFTNEEKEHKSDDTAFTNTEEDIKGTKKQTTIVTTRDKSKRKFIVKMRGVKSSKTTNSQTSSNEPMDASEMDTVKEVESINHVNKTQVSRTSMDKSETNPGNEGNNTAKNVAIAEVLHVPGFVTNKPSNSGPLSVSNTPADSSKKNRTNTRNSVVTPTSGTKRKACRAISDSNATTEKGEHVLTPSKSNSSIIIDSPVTRRGSKIQKSSNSDVTVAAAKPVTPAIKKVGSSEKGQIKSARKSNVQAEETISPLGRTRGRQMRFSKSGEKLF